MLLPKARTTDILEQDAGVELMIYDLRIDKAYTLNETSRIVYRACANNQSFDELKRRHNFTDDFIHLALDELQRNDLLVNGESRHFSGLARREMIKRVGLTCAAALPVIIGITAPRALHAASLAACSTSSLPLGSYTASQQPTAESCRSNCSAQVRIRSCYYNPPNPIAPPPLNCYCMF